MGASVRRNLNFTAVAGVVVGLLFLAAAYWPVAPRWQERELRRAWSRSAFVDLPQSCLIVLWVLCRVSGVTDLPEVQAGF